MKKWALIIQDHVDKLFDTEAEANAAYTKAVDDEKKYEITHYYGFNVKEIEIPSLENWLDTQIETEHTTFRANWEKYRETGSTEYLKDAVEHRGSETAFVYLRNLLDDGLIDLKGGKWGG